MTTVSPQNSPSADPTPGRLAHWRAGLRADPKVRWWQRIRSLVVLVVLVLLLGVVTATVLGAGLGALFYFLEGTLT
ncbi:MAG: hypothetical protein GY929_06610 [Actinomycetia bacterium]|nr:hypothetical protein [Actinomycetes bacterium]